MDQWSRYLSDSPRGATYIGVGLAILVAGAWLPNAPFITAVAIISLGATEITLARFRDKAALLTVLILHGAAYTGLYGLFIGATFHTAAISSQLSPSRLAAIDL